MFTAVLCIYCVCCAGAAVFFLAAAPRAGMMERFEKIPRLKWAGLVLAAWMIVVCVPHVEQLLEPGSVFVRMNLIPVFAAVLFVLIWLYADYIFARAFAVTCIYGAYLLLREGFAADPPFYPVMACGFFLLGTLGIVIAAKPVWMRDWLRAACGRAWVRYVSGGAFAAAG